MDNINSCEAHMKIKEYEYVHFNVLYIYTEERDIEIKISFLNFKLYGPFLWMGFNCLSKDIHFRLQNTECIIKYQMKRVIRAISRSPATSKMELFYDKS